MPHLRPVFVSILATTLAAGCSCGQEYTWSKSEVIDQFEAPIDHGSWMSLDTAPDGQRITMSYYDRTEKALGFAIGTPDPESGTVSWVHEHADGYPGADGLNPGDRGKFSSHKVAPDGTVWVAYHDGTNGGLMVAHRTGKVWETTKADTGAGARPDSGQWNSLALDADGRPVIAHYDEGSHGLRVTRLTELGPTLEDSTFSTEAIASGEDYSATDTDGTEVYRSASVGMFANLVIYEGTEYIAYYDAAQQTLNLIEGNGNRFKSPQVVDDAGNVGQWPSIWTDGNDLRIAYHDVGNQHLMLATRSGRGWEIEVVDDGEFRGADTALFAKDGAPAIVYFDGQDNNMMLATPKGNGWKTKAIGTEGAVGFHNEVVQVNGTFWAASYNFSNRQVFVTPI